MPKVVSSVVDVGVNLKVNYTLFTPGPIDIPEEVFNATIQPLLYHRSTEFSDFLFDLENKLKKVICTEKARLYFFASSGTGAMEAAFCNILKKCDRPIITVTGKFGERWVELCRTYNLEPIVLKSEYGDTVLPERLDQMVRKVSGTKIVFTTLTETSTGVLNDIKEYGEITQRNGAYLVVDGVAGIGADFCSQDEWHIDMLIGASQKALMAPPGVGFLSVNELAYERFSQSDLPRYYFDLRMYDKFSKHGQTPFTPAICSPFGLMKGLDIILKRGVKENLEHHKDIAEFVRSHVVDMGFKVFPLRPSNALTVIKMPDGISSTALLSEIKERYQIIFADGQRDLKGKIIRIGHMGNYDRKKLSRALEVLSEVLKNWRN